MKRATAKKVKPHTRRSSCPLAFALDIIGDRWTMLIIRDLNCGSTRFKDFAASPERIPTNILSDRLERLIEEQIIVQVPVAEGSKRLSYQLTPKGETLRPVLGSLHEWGLQWMQGTKPTLLARAPTSRHAPRKYSV